MNDILVQKENIKEHLVTKHGVWRSKNTPPTKIWQCSACKGLVQTAYYCYKCYYDYCPNCGAKCRQ